MLRLMTMAAPALLALALTTQGPASPLLLRPDDPQVNVRAPERFRVVLETSKGPMMLDVERGWSPHGIDRFFNLVRHGYFTNAKFFRVRAATWAQFGINADPAIATAWRRRAIPDDPRVLSNARGTVAYAFKDPNGRTTQMFINLKDNAATHDGEPFVPFAKVMSGMDAADALYADYGESAGGGIRGGKQDILFKEGNAHLDRMFPKLDYIKEARILP
jgi:peptidyl-prolyl cis-trans isomerase A (cyclophilin A)